MAFQKRDWTQTCSTNTNFVHFVDIFPREMSMHVHLSIRWGGKGRGRVECFGDPVFHCVSLATDKNTTNSDRITDFRKFWVYHIRKNLNLMSHRWVHRTDWKRTKEGVVHSVLSAFSLFSTRPYKLSGLFLFFITLYLVSFHSMCWQSSTVKLKQSKEEKTQTPETIMAWIMGGNINFYIEHLAHGTS